MDILIFGVCRCCLAQGNHRSLLKHNSTNGQKQTYSDLLMDCFNILLSSNPGLSPLICSSCIDRLRDAHTFKSQVLSNERTMLDSLKDTIKTRDPLTVNSQSPYMIIELSRVKSEVEDDETRGDTDDDTTCGWVSGAGRAPPLPSRDSLFNICPVYLGHLEALKEKTIDSADIKLLLETKPSKKPRQCRSKKRTEKTALATNTACLLENSTAVPFKMKMQSGFPCFYCRKIYPNPKDLRDHQQTHSKSSLLPLLSKYTADSLIVYADVTNLKCTLCSKYIQSLKELKEHLIMLHSVKFLEGYTDRIIPFKLNDREANFDCEICGVHYETFGAIDKHMGVHYRNFVCELCGSGFVTNHRLKVHTYALHQKKNSQIVCEICKKVFVTRLKYRIHYEYVHEKIKKLQCTLCEEKFLDYYARQRHLEEKHGVEKLQYKCNHCQRLFSRKFSLTSHVERYHMQVKKHQCEVCSYMCFSRQELRSHAHTHAGHVERSHARRHCGEAFPQSRALKSHLKLHSELLS